MLVLLMGLVSCNATQKEDVNGKSGYSTPEQEGISSRAILQFVEALEKEQPDAIHSLMLRRHGKIVAEGWWAPYSPDNPHLLWSLSKSFTSTAIGMAQDEGLLNIDDQVISFFPEDTPENPGSKLKAMRISDLLRMNTGHLHEPSFRNMQADNWAEVFLAHPLEFKPGTHFLYNSMATYMCSAIIQKVRGKTTLDYLTPRLFEPLGIESPTWETCPKGISVGGWGLSITTEDISKLGQLYLQKGKWEGKQLISEAWVEKATGNRTSNGSNPESDWEQGYGYQFWQCRHNAFRGDGAFGQYCLVMPEQDVVLAMTSGTDDMQGILNIVWEYLLPALEDGALQADEEGVGLLNQKLENLAIRVIEGKKSTPITAELSGRTYTLEQNKRGLRSISFDFEGDSPEISIASEGGEYAFRAGFGKNEPGLLPNPYVSSQKVAVSGAWVADDSFEVLVIYYETPQSVKYTFKFEDDMLYLNTELRASFGPKNLGVLKGVHP